MWTGDGGARVYNSLPFYGSHGSVLAGDPDAESALIAAYDERATGRGNAGRDDGRQPVRRAPAAGARAQPDRRADQPGHRPARRRGRAARAGRVQRAPQRPQGAARAGSSRRPTRRRLPTVAQIHRENIEAHRRPRQGARASSRRCRGTSRPAASSRSTSRCSTTRSIAGLLVFLVQRHGRVLHARGPPRPSLRAAAGAAPRRGDDRRRAARLPALELGRDLDLAGRRATGSSASGALATAATATTCSSTTSRCSTPLPGSCARASATSTSCPSPPFDPREARDGQASSSSAPAASPRCVHFYLAHDSAHEVVAFTVHRDRLGERPSSRAAGGPVRGPDREPSARRVTRCTSPSATRRSTASAPRSARRPRARDTADQLRQLEGDDAGATRDRRQLLHLRGQHDPAVRRRSATTRAVERQPHRPSRARSAPTASSPRTW